MKTSLKRREIMRSSDCCLLHTTDPFPRILRNLSRGSGLGKQRPLLKAEKVTLAIIQNTASAYQHIVAVLPPDETQWFGKRIDNINAKVLRNHIFATPDYEFTDDEKNFFGPLSNKPQDG